VLPPTLLFLVAWAAIAVSVRGVDDFLLAPSLYFAYAFEPHVHGGQDVGVKRLPPQLLHLAIQCRHLATQGMWVVKGEQFNPLLGIG